LVKGILYKIMFLWNFCFYCMWNWNQKLG